MVVGLTGGIGSGKTTVAFLFQKLGISIYNSDQRAKDLYQESRELREAMEFHFGKDIYHNNEINRTKLAKIVFSEKSKLELLNSLVHPLLQQDFEDWKNLQKSPYVIREAAILIESGADKFCDKIIVVVADEEVRLQRVMKRDKAKMEEVKARMNNQISDIKRINKSDFVVSNNGDSSLIHQVLDIHRKLLGAVS